MHLWSVFLVQKPQIFRGPAARRPRLQRCLRRLPPPQILFSTELVTMHLTKSTNVLMILVFRPPHFPLKQLSSRLVAKQCCCCRLVAKQCCCCRLVGHHCCRLVGHHHCCRLVGHHNCRNRCTFRSNPVRVIRPTNYCRLNRPTRRLIRPICRPIRPYTYRGDGRKDTLMGGARESSIICCKVWL